MSDMQTSSASVAESALADPAILQKALVAQKDDYLRLAADFDNFRKRTRRDAEQQAAAEKESFIRDLLPILDNLERALACEGTTSSAQLRQGVAMTLQQLGGLLHRHGIEPDEAVGRPFNPHRHEAVAVRHDPSQPDHIVLEVVQRGYCCGDKVFRPAKVIVNDPGQYIGATRVR
ncbi:MAG: nucleotide exchange factor GrpE [Chthoniobacter sp.]|nr:nucleotide exchange factor GrpE [Chthoniobacter sp.]